MTKILYYIQILRSSFWFVPLAIVLSGALAAITFLYVDRNIDFTPTGALRIVFSNSSDSSRSVLSSIAGAMIGVAGTVFSITLVVLTLASSQFGPRLLKNFMFKRLNQVVLGVYVSTYLYCLIVLNAVRDADEFTFVPNFSVLFAILLTFLSIILLIVFIHQVCTSIQPSYIIAEISEELEKTIDNIFPSNFGKELSIEHEEALEAIKKKHPIQEQILCSKNGYLQFIEHDELLNILRERDLLLEVFVRPGDYTVKGVFVAKVYASKSIDDKIIKEIGGAFVFTNRKNIFQDAEFAIHQIVEVAVKALSPGINDPYTAINCIDNLTSTLFHLAQTKPPSKYRYDDDNQLRVVIKTLTFPGLVNAAFNQIRQFGRGSPAVAIRLMESLTTLQGFVHRKEQKKIINSHADMILKSAQQSFLTEQDYLDLKMRHEVFLENN